MSELKSYTIYEGDVGNYTEHVVYSKSEADKVIAEKDAEIRRLRRALYKACANWACAKMEFEQFGCNVYMLGAATENEVSWESMMKKCLAMVEEYK